MSNDPISSLLCIEQSLLWVLVGPTATGKTETAIALAKLIDGEIISADSVQVYRGMDIGAAKPTREEREEIPFHLIDVVDPDVNFTAADWKTQAEAAIHSIVGRHKQPIICGGTGLYVRALLDDWHMATTPANPQVREQLTAELKQIGPQVLHARLSRVDGETAARLHPNDYVRIIRALEVYLVTGTPISVYQEEDRRTRVPRPAIRIGLILPRPSLYERIDRRVHAMIDAGLEAEVRQLLEKGYTPSLASMRSLGYNEMAAYLAGTTTLNEAIDAIKMNTRRYSKRQQTWFKTDTLISWIDVTDLTSTQLAAKIVQDTTHTNNTD